MGSAAAQGRLWSRAAAAWATLQEPQAVPLWEAMLDAAAVGRLTRLLDAGCGGGGASVLAAGRGATVNGLDAAPAMLSIARARVPDGDFQRGDLEALPYTDDTFDAIIAADVLAYVADPLAALRELRRVCAPHGYVVLAVWDTSEDCGLHAVVRAARALLPAASMGEQESCGHALSTAAVLDTLIEQAGLTVVHSATVACVYQYSDREVAWQAQVSAGPLQAVLRVVGSQQLKAAVLDALTPYTTSTGAVCVPASFRSVTAISVQEQQ